MSVAAAFAQQSQTPGKPLYTTPPTFPENQSRGIPPDTKAPPSQGSSTAKVAMEIEEKLDPACTNADVTVKADDSAVVLSGTVGSDEQLHLAIRIAKSYADLSCPAAPRPGFQDRCHNLHRYENFLLYYTFQPLARVTS